MAVTRKSWFGWVVGQTPEYQRLIEMCDRDTAALSLIGPLDLVIEAEAAAALRAAGQDMIAEVSRMLDDDRTRWRALDRLLTDVIAYLTPLDGTEALVGRVARARVVLGLSPEEGVANATPSPAQ